MNIDVFLYFFRRNYYLWETHSVLDSEKLSSRENEIRETRFSFFYFLPNLEKTGFVKKKKREINVSEYGWRAGN